MLVNVKNSKYTVTEPFNADDLIIKSIKKVSCQCEKRIEQLKCGGDHTRLRCLGTQYLVKKKSTVSKRKFSM